MFKKHESNKSQIITFHSNTLFVLSDGNIKSRSLKKSLENISKPTAWCIINSFTVMFWYSFLYHLLIHSTEQSSSWEGNRLSASQEIPRILRNRRLITAFTSARHLFLSWARSILSMPPNSTFGRSILILSSHLRLGLPRGLFPSGSPPKPCMHLSLRHTSHMLCSPHSLFYHPNNIVWGVQIIKLLII